MPKSIYPKSISKNQEIYNQNPVVCYNEYCNNTITFRLRNINKFCSKSCSATSNNKTRFATTSPNYKLRYLENPKKCTKCFNNLPYELRNRKTCGCIKAKEKIVKSCKLCDNLRKSKSSSYCESCYSGIRHYRSLANFTFNVYNFPDQFDLILLSKHGWYSPNGYGNKNKTPNLNGVSRDHLYSVSDGYHNNRDPKMLAHPANCKLMKHNGVGGNSSKHSKSSITWEELLHRIDNWNK